MKNQVITELNQEISLLDILNFLKGAYKTMFVFGFVGIMAAVAYLAVPIYGSEIQVRPNRYKILTTGLISTLCLGLSITLGKRMIAKLKSTKQEAN